MFSALRSLINKVWEYVPKPTTTRQRDLFKAYRRDLNQEFKKAERKARLTTEQKQHKAKLREQRKLEKERKKLAATTKKLETEMRKQKKENDLRSRLLSNDERLQLMNRMKTATSQADRLDIEERLKASKLESARRKRQLTKQGYKGSAQKRQQLNERYQDLLDVFRVQPNPILLRDQNGAKQYRIENAHIKNIAALKDYIMSTVREKVIENIPTKLNLVVKLTLIHASKTDDAGNPLKKPHHLEHRAKMIPQDNWFEPQYDELWETLFSNFYRITTSESGWRLFSIDYTDIILSNYEQVGGQGFQVLPAWVGNRGGIINPRSVDGECFKDAIAIAANLDYFEGVRNPQRITETHKDLALEFDFTGIGPSPGEKEWKLFEKNNPSVNLKIYYPDPFKSYFITSCYKTPILEDGKRTRKIELFLDITDEGHYSAIKNKSALLSKQMTGKRKKKCYFCDRCDNVSKTAAARDNHQKRCFGQRTRKFKNKDSNGKAPVWKFTNIKGLSIAPDSSPVAFGVTQ